MQNFGEQTKSIMVFLILANWGDHHNKLLNYNRPYAKVAAILIFFCLHLNNPTSLVCRTIFF